MLWQVDAAALGLSVAIVVVALEVFSARSSAPLQENVRETALLPIAYVGTSALVVNCLVLVELPRALEGGPATWAALLSGLSLVLLPVLFGRASNAIDHAVILKNRALRAAAEAQLAVAQSLFDRIAYSLLVHKCNDASIQLQGFLPPPTPPGATPVRATKPGVVQDINLYRLGRLAVLAEDARAAGTSGEVVLGVHVGARVSVGALLLSLPAGLPPKAVRMAERVVLV